MIRLKNDGHEIIVRALGMEPSQETAKKNCEWNELAIIMSEGKAYVSMLLIRSLSSYIVICKAGMHLPLIH